MQKYIAIANSMYAIAKGVGFGFSQVTEPIRGQSKVGRNEPCPCGSGKKYKKCCIK